MAKLRLPEQLKDWKVLSTMPDKNGYPAYKVEKTEFDGEKKRAELTFISYEGEEYNSDNVELVNEEAAFIKNIIGIRGISNYIDAVTDNIPSKGRINLFILTEELASLSEKIKRNPLNEEEIVDFGLQMSDILDKLESNNILHGNINPDNVYVAKDGSYRLGGFTAFEMAENNHEFSAPEIKDNTQPNSTTDIYSLGLIMYSLSNDGKLPYENETPDINTAVQKRFSSATVPAPKNGSEKLKSVIVIACQHDSKNRWKNAGNIKNALSSIKSEMPSGVTSNAAVIAPASTEFESNVFEEFEYDSFEPETQAPETTHVEEQKPVADDKTVLIEEPSDDKTVLIEESSNDKTQVIEDDENEIDNRVFDDYKLQTKVFNINSAVKKDDKDYGDYFEEPLADDSGSKQNDENQVSEFEGNSFYREDGEEDEPQDEEKTGRKGLVIAIIVVAALVLASLAAIGVIGARSGWFDNLFGKNNETTAAATEAQTTQAASAETTKAAETTQPASTQETTSQPEEPATQETPEETQPVQQQGSQVPDNVVGYYFDYATYILRGQGFNVEIGDFELSDNYDYGFVIAMSPDSGEALESGSTIKLTVSSGRKNPSGGSESSQTSSQESESSSNETNSEDVSNTSSAASSAESTETVFSEGKVNTSYLSQSEVNAMSQDELNLTLNEIYARRGRIFTNSSLSSYFSSQSWYTPKYNEAEFSQKVVFNNYEAKNIDMLRNRQIEKGYY